MPIEHLDLSEREFALVEVYALAQGLSIDEAATKLATEKLAERMRRVTNRPSETVRAPATVHYIGARKS